MMTAKHFALTLSLLLVPVVSLVTVPHFPYLKSSQLSPNLAKYFFSRSASLARAFD